MKFDAKKDKFNGRKEKNFNTNIFGMYKQAYTNLYCLNSIKEISRTIAPFSFSDYCPILIFLLKKLFFKK